MKKSSNYLKFFNPFTFKNNCYKNGKNINCKNKIFKEHFNSNNMMNSFSKKSFKKRCYINKKE